MNREELEAQIAEYPVCEYAFIDIKDIRFLEEVRYICKTECSRYGKSWSCPPAVGTVKECQERCAHYTGGFLFTTVTEVEDITDLEETLATRAEHEKITRGIRDLFREQCRRIQVLSTESCAICEHCTYPDAPCRFPDKMFPAMESYGILVTELAEKYGITFMNGSNVATWFSLILYEE